MESSSRPQAVLRSGFVEALEGLACAFPEDACKVKTATPEVTASTTRYLYSGYRRWKSVMCRNMTGSSLQDLARMKVM